MVKIINSYTVYSCCLSLLEKRTGNSFDTFVFSALSIFQVAYSEFRKGFFFQLNLSKEKNNKNKKTKPQEKNTNNHMSALQ